MSNNTELILSVKSGGFIHFTTIQEIIMKPVWVTRESCGSRKKIWLKGLIEYSEQESSN